MHDIALLLERRLEGEYRCSAHGIGGIINADHIRHSGFFTAIVLHLIGAYTSEANRVLIDSFISNIKHYEGISMDDIDEKEIHRIMKNLKDLRIHLD